MAYIINSKQDVLTGLTSTVGTIAATDTILTAFGKVLNGQTNSYVLGGNSFTAPATLGTNDNFELALRTNGSTKLTILPNGNVGIGQVSPTYTLEVNGTGWFQSDLTIQGNLTVNGTTTTVNSTTLTVDDKNIEIGSVSVPSDATADGGGITLKGTTDKTISWTSADSIWHYNQGIGLDNQTAIRFYELTANGSNYVELKAPTTLTGDTSYILPATDGTAGSSLTTNASGVLSWSTASDSKITTVNTGTYTVLSSDYIVYVTANSTLTLPAGVVGMTFKIAARNITTVTINAAGANLINGASSVSLNAYNFITLRFLGTNDWAIGD
jgi:hypothetical protein